MDPIITRRRFMGQVAGAAVCISFLPCQALASLSKEKKNIITIKPYWLDTLSKGPRHCPHNVRVNLPAEATDNDLKNSAYEIWRRSSDEIRAVRDRRIKRTNQVMDRIVFGYKKSQYLFWQIKPDFQYRCTDFMDDIFFDEDPVLGRVMKDLSKMILDYIDHTARQSDFKKFGPYHRRLLHAAMDYAFEGVGVYEKVLSKTFESHKPVARKRLAETYGHYGSALHHLGRNTEAIAAFSVALQLSPDDPQAKQYLEKL